MLEKFLVLSDNKAKNDCSGIFLTIINRVCVVKKLETRVNCKIPVLQFIKIILWPLFPVLHAEGWSSGGLWFYLNHCITVFWIFFVISHGSHFRLFDGINMARNLERNPFGPYELLSERQAHLLCIRCYRLERSQ